MKDGRFIQLKRRLIKRGSNKLVVIAMGLGIDPPDKATKPEILELIEQAPEPGEDGDGEDDDDEGDDTAE